ncbi:hypothetical protein [Pseudomonas taeanensis]|nr:hypothetical protein [Pseudomonas taeanensis]
MILSFIVIPLYAAKGAVQFQARLSPLEHLKEVPAVATGIRIVLIEP